MQCVQNYAARIVTGIQKYDHITPCLKELKWLPVSKELYLRDAVMTFKYIKGTAPTYLTQHFRSRLSISGRTTRQSNDIQIPKCRTATGQSRLLAEHRLVSYAACSRVRGFLPTYRLLTAATHSIPIVST
jgi:hypothetical protein